MASERPSQWLTQQHRELDTFMKRLMEQDGDLQLLRKSLDLLTLHLFVEEEITFGPIDTGPLRMPIYIMHCEHGEMWAVMDELDFACREGRALDLLRRPCRRLVRLFNVHNPKEEDLIYAAIDQYAAGDGVPDVLVAMQAARVPDGWVCRSERPGFAPPPGAPPWERGSHVR